MWDALNRAERYRDLAEECRRLAATSLSPQMRSRFSRMAPRTPRAVFTYPRRGPGVRVRSREQSVFDLTISLSLGSAAGTLWG